MLGYCSNLGDLHNLGKRWLSEAALNILVVEVMRDGWILDIFCKQKQQNLLAGWKGNITERSQGVLKSYSPSI